MNPVLGLGGYGQSGSGQPQHLLGPVLGVVQDMPTPLPFNQAFGGSAMGVNPSVSPIEVEHMKQLFHSHGNR